ncbi:hypothetical protein SKAU_G00014220 [Synaphobranchus kaupii]|uniref:Uncharacterized protein n=1 Tax=Synaphobranchus kaupii TaxID=118154 RepID=A0A9Q1GAM1_SYNKA|nr:hypothetical protein SKAU_G00014220 [Synaphobranchus kaupii]
MVRYLLQRGVLSTRATKTLEFIETLQSTRCQYQPAHKRKKKKNTSLIYTHNCVCVWEFKGYKMYLVSLLSK